MFVGLDVCPRTQENLGQLHVAVLAACMQAPNNQRRCCPGAQESLYNFCMAFLAGKEQRGELPLPCSRASRSALAFRRTSATPAWPLKLALRNGVT